MTRINGISAFGNDLDGKCAGIIEEWGKIDEVI